MLTKHSIKVLIGFSGMIILGLISLVIIDHFREKDESTAFKTPAINDKLKNKATPLSSPSTQKSIETSKELPKKR